MTVQDDVAAAPAAARPLERAVATVAEPQDLLIDAEDERLGGGH